MKYFLVLIFIFFGQFLWAQNQPTTKIQFAQEMFSGEKNKTFDRENVSNGFEMILSSKKSSVNYFTRGRFTTVSGSQEFLDNGTEVDSDFTFYKSSFEVGANLYPLTRKSRQANLYIGLSAIVSYNYMSLESDELTEIKSSYQAMSFGYAGTMGVEWELFKGYSLTAEFAQRFESANLVEVSNFSLNSFSIGIGVGW